MSSSTRYFGKPAPPGERTCDWCGEQAASAYEIYRPRKKVGTALYVYACRAHESVAKEASRAPRKAA